MALNGDALGTAIRDALLAINPDSGLLSGAEDTALEGYWQAAANEIVDHFVANGVIIPDTFVVNHSGVRPVTGTGKIT